MTTQHTSTPWRFDMEILSADGLPIASVYGTEPRLNEHNDRDECLANAAFIVQTVNAHDDLVAACAASVRAFDMLNRNTQSIIDLVKRVDGMAAGAASDTLFGVLRMLDHSRAALAKAGKEVQA